MSCWAGRPADSPHRTMCILAPSLDDVNNAGRANPMGVLASQGQSDTTYDPAGLLDYGQTYYWRVDEVNAAPDNTIFKGDVWSFTAEPFAYPVTPVAAKASGSGTNMGPQNTINGSGLNADDQHSVESTKMWISNGAQARLDSVRVRQGLQAR